MSQHAFGSLRGRLQSTFGGPAESYEITTQRQPSRPRVNTQALQQQFTQQSTQFNANIQSILDRQREQTASLFGSAREFTQQTGASRREEISRTRVQQQGRGTQSLISRGLGNTTIQDSLTRGINADAARAMTQQRDLEAGRVSNLFAQEAGQQGGIAQTALSGTNLMTGGLEDYIRLLQMLGGGLS